MNGSDECSKITSDIKNWKCTNQTGPQISQLIEECPIDHIVNSKSHQTKKNLQNILKAQDQNDELISLKPGEAKLLQLDSTLEQTLILEGSSAVFSGDFIN